MTDLSQRLLGIPVVYDRHIPKGTAYLINSNMMVFGTWVAPQRLPSVARIIASQRRRRHR